MNSVDKSIIESLLYKIVNKYIVCTDKKYNGGELEAYREGAIYALSEVLNSNNKQKEREVK